ncbi:MAG: glycosyltransferase family 2 protein [Acidobacteriaceae bacterium]|nr:glycosyltransferase family 2 protein [Acidobacteriaceae bacterium]
MSPTASVTILMPCLNEAETLAVCVRKARAAIDATGLPGEVLVADNGSTDGSQAIAEAEGARVLPVPVRGYGAALIAGIENAQGKYILMGDADDSYDFSHLSRFVSKLDEGYDLVMGNRFQGGILNHAMPPLHRYLGNPVLSFIGRLFFRVPTGDFHCGLRAFRADKMRSLGLRTTGMEFASEMVVRSALTGFRIGEVPTTLQPDGRSRAPHLRTWRDGWRHLQFLLMYSPRWLFFYPGVFLMFLGLVLSLWLLPAERQVGNLHLDVDTLVYALFALMIGVHMSVFAVSARVFGAQQGFLPPSSPAKAKLIEMVNPTNGLLAGVVFLLLGLSVAVYAVLEWKLTGFGTLTATRMLRFTLPSATALMLGVEAIFASFFIGLLQIKHR